ncbi:acyl carrier protein 2, mitochondrial-like [Telopea speciosissima]|uniref:acyl carrier protein 2, mitochondrial-like n=1 Tax=Telopea speciosissima TaxID=54955 RepID=UPI001CC3A7D2|nr:acyl carrier protein 2, mitochondrial-like [Telopea speciosissima]
MQILRTGIRSLRSASSASVPSDLWRCIDGAFPAISVIRRGGSFADSVSVLGFIAEARTFSQSSACASATCLDKAEVTTRVVGLLKSIPFVDPVKVSPVASFKDDLQLDTLDNVEVMMAVEEEFAVDIPDTEACKVSTTAHLIDYIAIHPQAK